LRRRPQLSIALECLLSQEEVSVMKRVQECTHVMLCAWVLLSPWVLKLTDVQGVAAWARALVGAALLALSAPILLVPKAWEHVTTTLLGLALLVCPWLLEYSGRTGPVCSAVIAAVLIAGLGLSRLTREDLLIQWQRRGQAGFAQGRKLN